MKELIEKYAAPVLFYILSYFAPVYPMMIVIGFFVLSDFGTGIMAAKKRGEKILSDKMKDTAYKGCAYMIALLVSYVFQLVFMPNFEVLKIVSGLIAFIEVKSLDENFRDITGKSVFKQFLKK